MEIASHWIIWCDSKDERKARKILDRVADVLKRTPSNVTIALDDALHAVRFRLPVHAQAWSDMVLELMQLGYSVAHQWTVLPGTFGRSIYESAEGWTTSLSSIRIAGVKVVHWHIENHVDP